MASFASSREADLLVLGSGIAAMLLAERALERGRRVLLVERGTAIPFADRLRRGAHTDPLPFNRAPHVVPAAGGRDAYYVHPVYNVGGTTSLFFGNMPRIHPAHFEAGPFGGASRRWPLRYADLEPYYLQAERRLGVSGDSAHTPFPGRFDYPLPPHRLSPMDRACRDVFGAEHVMAVPTVRPTRPVGGRPACCGSNHCGLCPVDAKGTALNTVFPAIRERVELATGLLAEEVRCARGRVDHVVARDAEGRKHRLAGRQVVVACNGIDSCMLLLRSPEVPRHAALGRYYMDHATFSLAAYGTGLPTRPGLADSAQTGTITRFFEKTGDDLPVSLLGAAKSADVVGDAGGAERARIVPDLFRLAAEGRLSRAATLRERVKEVWDSLLVVRFLVETQPRAENRVEIARIAPSGQPIPRVVLDYPAYLEACIARVTEVMRKALPRADVRFVRRDPGAQHWLGATRMSEREEDGCVDRDLRWHGLAGLYVLSGSVFPGSSSANPTLTIAALALRLGDRLGAGTPSGL